MAGKSPFPGMDPYLEEHWRDVHHALVTYTRDTLQEHLPEHLRARMEERVLVADEEGGWRGIHPDVRIYGRPGLKRTPGGGVALAEPGPQIDDSYILYLKDESISEIYLEIIDISTGYRVVTVIEFVSPTNKTPGDGRKQYLEKQRECRSADVNLVEIDLTRTGDRGSVFPIDDLPAHMRDATYLASVYRAFGPNALQFFSLPLQCPLREIPIPLRPDDAEINLNLQALVDEAYRKGRYDDVDYAKEPRAPLSHADAKWAEELLKKAGKR